ncbi:DnaT-like ssDNA-binding domain-containing protein [Klebsiella aerogenes]
MHHDWKPSAEFPRQATLWGMPLKPGLNLPAELSSFIAYWQAEGKVFHQVQWEQKLARHLSRAEVRHKKPVNGGNANAGVQPDNTRSRAVQEIQAARERWARRNGLAGGGNCMAPMDSHGGNIFEQVDTEERGGALGYVDGQDWSDE